MDVEINIADGILIGIENLDDVIENVDARMSIARIIKGDRGHGVVSVEKTSTDVLVDTYTVTYSDGRTDTFQVANGNGIVSIEKTNEEAFIDTYTITFDNNTTTTFQVVNGSGIVEIRLTSMIDLVDTYTIYREDGKTTTFEVTNGKKGEKGEKGDTTVADGVPKGGIIMWSGRPTDIPSGWKLCMGAANNTPDLRGRFIIGYTDSGTSYDKSNYGMGEAKGAATVTLSEDEIPAHTHQLPGNAIMSDWGVDASNDRDKRCRSVDSTTTSTGGSKAHENRPPYYTLAYIIKV